MSGGVTSADKAAWKRFPSAHDYPEREAFALGYYEAEAEFAAREAALVETLEHIAEYWNRDRNDMAMHDACWFAITAAEEAVASSIAARAHTTSEGEGA